MTRAVWNPYLPISVVISRGWADAALETYAEFAAATRAEDPFALNGILYFMPRLPAFLACQADPTAPPDMSEFVALRERRQAIFDAVFATHRLDAMIMPQMREQLAAREGKDIIHETTGSEINIAGLPGVFLRVATPRGRRSISSPWGRFGANRNLSGWRTPTSRRPITANRRTCLFDAGLAFQQRGATKMVVDLRWNSRSGFG